MNRGTTDVMGGGGGGGYPQQGFQFRQGFNNNNNSSNSNNGFNRNRGSQSTRGGAGPGRNFNANQSSDQSDANRPVKRKAEAFTCTVCSIEVTSAEVLQSHMNGQKHAKKLRQIAETSGQSPAKPVGSDSNSTSDKAADSSQSDIVESTKTNKDSDTSSKIEEATKNPFYHITSFATFHGLKANFDMVGESGPPHARTFEAKCSLLDTQTNKTVESAHGSGTSISRARQAAADLILKQTKLKIPTSEEIKQKRAELFQERQSQSVNSSSTENISLSKSSSSSKSSSTITKPTAEPSNPATTAALQKPAQPGATSASDKGQGTKEASPLNPEKKTASVSTAPPVLSGDKRLVQLQSPPPPSPLKSQSPHSQPSQSQPPQLQSPKTQPPQSPLPLSQLQLSQPPPQLQQFQKLPPPPLQQQFPAQKQLQQAGIPSLFSLDSTKSQPFQSTKLSPGPFGSNLSAADKKLNEITKAKLEEMQNIQKEVLKLQNEINKKKTTPPSIPSLFSVNFNQNKAASTMNPPHGMDASFGSLNDSAADPVDELPDFLRERFQYVPPSQSLTRPPPPQQFSQPPPQQQFQQPPPQLPPPLHQHNGPASTSFPPPSNKNSRYDNNNRFDNRFDNNRTENSRFDSNRGENNRFENNHGENNRFGNNRGENNRFDNNRSENNRFDNNRAENNRFENNRFGNSRFDNNRFDNKRPMKGDGNEERQPMRKPMPFSRPEFDRNEQFETNEPAVATYQQNIPPPFQLTQPPPSSAAPGKSMSFMSLMNADFNLKAKQPPPPPPPHLGEEKPAPSGSCPEDAIPIDSDDTTNQFMPQSNYSGNQNNETGFYKEQGFNNFNNKQRFERNNNERNGDGGGKWNSRGGGGGGGDRQMNNRRSFPPNKRGGGNFGERGGGNFGNRGGRNSSQNFAAETTNGEMEQNAAPPNDASQANGGPAPPFRNNDKRQNKPFQSQQPRRGQGRFQPGQNKGRQEQRPAPNANPAVEKKEIKPNSAAAAALAIASRSNTAGEAASVTQSAAPVSYTSAPPPPPPPPVTQAPPVSVPFASMSMPPPSYNIQAAPTMYSMYPPPMQQPQQPTQHSSTGQIKAQPQPYNQPQRQPVAAKPAAASAAHPAAATNSQPATGSLNVQPPLPPQPPMPTAMYPSMVPNAAAGYPPAGTYMDPYAYQTAAYSNYWSQWQSQYYQQWQWASMSQANYAAAAAAAAAAQQPAVAPVSAAAPVAKPK